ncbi:MAG: N-acetylglucosamine-6-phosphate deacetylase [Negativicutes bacterium]|nr:N-acetylglucosamine-6-phosphate deacetylase [Negativicutes bacterium]
MSDKILFKNCALVMPDTVLHNCDLLVAGGKIAAVGQLAAGDHPVYDMENQYLIPGLIDLHVHGAAGFDTMDFDQAGALPRLASALLSEGTVAFLPTTMSCTMSELTAVLDNIERQLPAIDGADIVGTHLEGPFISPQAVGAQSPDKVPADDDREVQEAFAAVVRQYSHLIRIVSFAPERKDGQFIAGLCSHHRIIASCAHTRASYEQMVEAIERWGVDNLTHSFNAMPGIHHRSPGPLVAAMENDRVWMELIADGVHVHPAVLALTVAARGIRRICMVSDGTRAVGMPDGKYELGGQEIFVANGVARLADGTIAGSAFPLLAGVRTMVNSRRLAIYDAVRLASLNPARRLGIDYRLGSLERGKEASFVVVDREISRRQVWRRGLRIN